jgi:predicted RNA-binding Zn-ribbon protein involved in translation (DUF1610 family)
MISSARASQTTRPSAFAGNRSVPSDASRIVSGIVSDDETEHDQPEPLATEGQHIPPTFNATHFHCPLCGVLAQMEWDRLQARVARGGRYTMDDSDAARVRCRNCHEDMYWVNYPAPKDLQGTTYVVDNWRMVRPAASPGPRPHAQMPDNVRADYEEARSIVAQSPRGASALLRFALQELLEHLGQKGKKPNDAIKALVADGLPVQTQRALDILRVVGNNAVHPLELDLRDDVETATGLFGVINFIVQDRIAQPKEIAKMFDMLPEGSREAIERRDGTNPADQ